jgi:hypothetical protein
MPISHQEGQLMNEPHGESESSVAQSALAENAPSTGSSNRDDDQYLVHRAHIQFVLFILMLVLALIGMGITQALPDGGWEYWAFLVLVYGLISVTATYRQAKSRGEPIWQMIRKQVLHWAGALVAFKLLFLLERTDIVSREATSDLSVILLSLICYLAGVHFQWMFILIGLVVGVMALTLAYLEQYMVIGWIIVIPTALVASWLFLKFRNRR